jgi:hypothetical protein
MLKRASPLAAKIGRLTLLFIGAMFVVAAIVQYAGAGGEMPNIAILFFVVGFAHLGAAVLASNKAAAYFAFWAPWILP